MTSEKLKKAIIFPTYYEALASEYPDLTLGRVILQEKGLYRILTADGPQPFPEKGSRNFEHGADLASDLDSKRVQVQGSAIGVDILTTSAINDELDTLLSYISPGKTIAFVGSSGAGKSTLINHLLGEERLKTGRLRNDDRGRHTTTHRELIVLPNGAMVIDTPGMRELGMWDASEGIDTAFSDIEELTEKCRFSDCTHSGEPGCAVCEALESGKLSQSRWQSYLKLTAENAYAEDADGYLAAKEKKFKDIAKYKKMLPKQHL